MQGPTLYCGDPHGRFRHIIKAANEFRASAVVLLGDMEPQRPLAEEMAGITVPWYFIPGNHDADSVHLAERVWDTAIAARNIHGRVVLLPNGTRLAGLGGVFRESVWYPSLPAEPKFRNREEHARLTPRQDRWRDGVPRKHWSSIYPDELDALADIRADALVTHEAPGYYGHAGFEILDTLAQSMGAKMSVHGHHHDRLDSSERWTQQGFKSYGVGLRGITAIDADGNATVIVPGELDEQRNFRQRYMDVFKDVE
jgi:predicted phosphodiesterase